MTVKKVKLRINPATMPYGRRWLLPSLADEARIIGKIGRIHGERIVTTPARKAKTVSMIILV